MEKTLTPGYGRRPGELVCLGRAVISLEPNGKPSYYSGRLPAARLPLARICSHYFSHGVWLEEGALLRDANRLTGTPGVLVHGRFDLGTPLSTSGSWPAPGPAYG